MRRSGIWDGLGVQDSGLSVCSFGFRLGSEDDLCGFRHPLFYGIFSVEDGVMTRFSQEEMHEADWCLTGPVASWKTCGYDDDARSCYVLTKART